ncbi:DUF5462 family protein [Photobacterium damselae]|uniref:DUF5462 family protein n=1 Tax=Photobacterium damselae TaxID=38293 RepID=UPI004067610A
MAMKMMTLSVLCCALLTQSALAKSVDMTTTPIDFGMVNGEVFNDEIKVEKSLSNPILISVKQQDYNKPLEEFVIKDAVLTHQSTNELILTVTSPLSGAVSMQSLVGLGLWVDGNRIPLMGNQVGSGVRIPTPSRYKKLELRVVKPIEMTLPRSYRGKFKYSLEIEAATK